MLDLVLVLSKSGVVLWQQQFGPVKGNPVDALVRTVLLEERTGLTEFEDDANTVKWTLDNEMHVVVIAVYQRALRLPYVDELLRKCREAFCALLKGIPEAERDNAYPCARFGATYAELQAAAEQSAVQERLQQKKPRTFAESKKYANTRQGQKESALGIAPPKPPAAGGAAGPPSPSPASPAAARAGDGADADDAGADGAALSAEAIAANRAKLASKGGPKKKKGGGGRGKGGGGGGGGGGEEEEEEEEGAAKKGKEKRAWDDTGAGKSGKAGLDFSKKGEGGAPAPSRAAVYRASKALDLDADFGEPDAPAADEGSAAGAAPALEKGQSSFFGGLRGMVGGKPLTQESLEPVVNKLRDRLVEKNVAQDIGQQVCDSVCSSLLGKQLSSFAGLTSTVRGAMEDALTRILTPTRRIDVLADVERARAAKRPYVIVFVGVNGVGKSTSLSKVAYYLKSNGFTPMLCACDTFRSGAVEQLRVHAQSLEVPLYEKGYGRDASGIATDGISHAKQMGYDVVMVDTAGRMQDNEPLMRALAKLVNVNSPDLVLFVGEALAGNDAVDQVTGFNQALGEYSVARAGRLIDGIMLTKFDTINDKVGAALSLVYTTGKPIVFVGVGQTYTDIRNLNVDHIVRALLR